MKFHGSLEVIELSQKRRNMLIVTMVLGILFLLLVMANSNNSALDKTFHELAREFDTKVSTIENAYSFITIFAFSAVIAQAAGIYMLSRHIKRVENSYLYIEEDRIRGVAYPSERGEPQSFEVALKDVRNANFTGSNDGFNLMIQTTYGTYYCLAIHNADRAACIINEGGYAMRETRSFDRRNGWVEQKWNPASAEEWVCSSCGHRNIGKGHVCQNCFIMK